MIRKATLNDLEWIDQLSRENFETSFSKESLKNMIVEEETYHIFLAEKKEFIGYVIIWESDTFGQIVDIVVKNEYQGLGYGKSLLDYGLNYLKDMGIDTISLEVKVSNTRAIKLYESKGFILDHTIKNYYKEEDGYFYIRKREK